MELDSKVRSGMATSVRRMTPTLVSGRFGLSSDNPGTIGLARWWRRLGLAGQFLGLTVAMMVAAFTIATITHNRMIERDVAQASAEIASVYLRGIVQPHLDRLADGSGLAPEDIERIDEAIAEGGLSAHMREVKIWSPDGTVVYSTNREEMGRKYASRSVSRAARGALVINPPDGKDHHHDNEDFAEVFELYIPLSDENGRIFAVGEFYQDYTRARAVADRAILDNWGMTAVFLVPLLGFFFLLFRRADRTVRRQQRQIQRHLVKARKLAVHNARLREQADSLRRKAALEMEQLLSRVGAEIHDGPIQLLSLLALQPDAGREGASQSGALLPEVISELRGISAGLILPEISELTVEEAIRLAVARHELRTGTTVTIEIDALPAQLSPDLKAVSYRIVQECLNNATRHADGLGQSVRAHAEPSHLVLVVEDRGPGMAPPEPDDRERLGLVGIRSRVAASNGTFAIENRDDGGLRVTVRLPTGAPH